jgi:DsbC/DsbD-like thiol-disulfide interchange protein
LKLVNCFHASGNHSKIQIARQANDCLNKEPVGYLVTPRPRWEPMAGAHHQIRKNLLDALCIGTKMRGWNPSSGLYWALRCGAALLLCAASAQAEGVPIPHGTLQLMARNQWIAAGHTLDLGLRFQLEKGWHIYWINPGDSGEPPHVEWQLPAGLTAGSMEWPTPRRLETSSIVDYGYEDAVLLIVPMHAEARLAAQQAARLGAEVRLLVCSHEMCIPGKAELSLTLPIKSQPPPPEARNQDAQTIELFTAARRSLPRPAPGNWRFSVADASDSFVLRANLGHRITRAIFFPLAESQIENAAPQKLLPVATGFRLTLRKSEQFLKPIERLKGVLVLSADRSYLIDVPLSKSGAARSKAAPVLQSTLYDP